MTGSATSTTNETTTESDQPDEGEPRSWFTLDRLWLWAFLALVAAALPLLVFHYGARQWFAGDEWWLLVDQAGAGVPDLLEPHGGSHWVAVPRVIYRGLWEVFGIDSYRPYLLVVVVMHLAVAVLLRVVMRRSGVSPLLASAAAALFVLCGPGATNTVWAFQVSFVGSMTWGLAHLVLADHDGPLDRRDLAGLGFGLLAITSSGVGVSTTVAVGVAVLLRRGWRSALTHTAPLAVIQLGWVALVDATVSGPFGRPPLSVLIGWVGDSAVGALIGLGHLVVVAWVLLALLVVGLVLVVRAARGPDAPRLRTAGSMPIGLAVAALFFAVTTGTVRSWLGAETARADRYIYLYAAFLLPLLAVAAQAVARRWQVLTPALAALFLLPIPFNLTTFDDRLHFTPAILDDQRFVLTTAVRMPFARDVPDDVSPIPRAFIRDATIGFLLAAEADGKLTPSTVPLTTGVVNEFKVRLGVAQRRVLGSPTGCHDLPGPIDIAPAKGDVLQLAGTVTISTVDDDQPTSRPILFKPDALHGSELTIELPDLHLRLEPPIGATTVALCEDRLVFEGPG